MIGIFHYSYDNIQESRPSVFHPQRTTYMMEMTNLPILWRDTCAHSNSHIQILNKSIMLYFTQIKVELNNK
jgi:hypothetical protein